MDEAEEDDLMWLSCKDATADGNRSMMPVSQASLKPGTLSRAVQSETHLSQVNTLNLKP